MPIGIVIVSHSPLLAKGVQELAEQMTQGKVPIAIAAGIDDPDSPLGTDATQIYQAIESVYHESGVVVLMDLGSALLSAEMALEFLTDAQRENVRLCDAPLVEGAIAAAVAASANHDLTQVMAEAKGSLAAKAAQLGVSEHPSPSLDTNDSPDPGDSFAQTIQLTVRNRLGLHARPAAQFVATASRFQAQIRLRNVTKATEFVRADSINQVAMLGVRQGDQIEVTAQGVDADAALAALQDLVADNFGERDDDNDRPSAPPLTPSAPITSRRDGVLAGIPASPGVAIAPLVHYHAQPIEIQQYAIDHPEAEWQRLQTAVQMALQEIETLRSQAVADVGEAQAAIFDAHRLVLSDPVLLEAVQSQINEQQINAEAAWQAAIEEIAAAYRQQEDTYMQARAGDILDVGQRVLRHLTGRQAMVLDIPQPSILVAPDLTPSDTAQLPPDRVLGICTTAGSATSHSAILARSLGIPAVVGVDSALLQCETGTLIAIDGQAGHVWVEPDAETIAMLEAKRQSWQTIRQQAQTTAHQPAITRDGRHLTVLANIGSRADAQLAIERGADGIGLLRTEFLYLNRISAPSEAEQVEVYQAIAAHVGTRPLIIRTLDVGGDKPLPYLSMPPEANPFLGQRGIRVCLAQPDVFRQQLRAILQASCGHAIKVMFPMIATVAEVRAAKAFLQEAQAELPQADYPINEAIEVGIMVEVPAAVAIADQLAAEVDFFSIGTNDLSQYVMAADRMNAHVASLADALHPAVLRMVQQTIQAGHNAGIEVGVCGELAADPVAMPILLGLGVDEVSVNPSAVPLIKQVVTQLTQSEAEAIATSAVQQTTSAEVRTVVTQAIPALAD